MLDEEGHMDWPKLQLDLLQRVGEPTHTAKQMSAAGDWRQNTSMADTGSRRLFKQKSDHEVPSELVTTEYGTVDRSVA